MNNATWQELNDPWNEFGTLDFDKDMPEYSDDVDWWRDQDADLEAQELARLESDAQIFDYRMNGYE